MAAVSSRHSRIHILQLFWQRSSPTPKEELQFLIQRYLLHLGVKATVKRDFFYFFFCLWNSLGSQERKQRTASGEGWCRIEISNPNKVSSLECYVGNKYKSNLNAQIYIFGTSCNKKENSITQLTNKKKKKRPSFQTNAIITTLYKVQFREILFGVFVFLISNLWELRYHHLNVQTIIFNNRRTLFCFVFFLFSSQQTIWIENR